MAIEVYIDGASRGNPGESGVGVVINFENSEKKEHFQLFMLGIADRTGPDVGARETGPP